jgi:Holliday junction resolvase
MNGAYSRAKGARAELELCHLLSDYLGGEFSRNLKQYQKAQHGDIEQLVGPYLIECKNQATLAIPQWWRQACDAAKARGAVPCLAYKLFRRGWKFVVPLPEAVSANASWSWDLQYTMELHQEGFFLMLRERGV